MSISTYLDPMLMLPAATQAAEAELVTLFPILTKEMYVPILKQELARYRGGERLYEYVRRATIAAYINLNGQENPRVFFWATHYGFQVSNTVRNQAFKTEPNRRMHLAETCNVMFPAQRSGDRHRNTWNELEYCLQEHIAYTMNCFIEVGYNAEARPLHADWATDRMKIMAQAMWERICEHATKETMAAVELPDLFARA